MLLRKVKCVIFDQLIVVGVRVILLIAVFSIIIIRERLRKKTSPQVQEGLDWEHKNLAFPVYKHWVYSHLHISISA